METFPNQFREAINRAVMGKQVALKEYEYWGVPMIDISWDDGVWVQTLQFEFRGKEIGVARKKERFSGWRAILRWAYDVLPLFPYLGKSVVATLDPIRIEGEANAYENKIRSYAETAI